MCIVVDVVNNFTNMGCLHNFSLLQEAYLQACLSVAPIKHNVMAITEVGELLGVLPPILGG